MNWNINCGLEEWRNKSLPPPLDLNKVQHLFALLTVFKHDCVDHNKLFQFEVWNSRPQLPLENHCAESEDISDELNGAD